MTATRAAPSSANHSGVTGGPSFADSVAGNTDALWQRAYDELTISSGASTADSLVCTAGVTLLAYAVGNSFWLTPLLTNTTNVTINIDSRGVKDIVGPDGSPLVAGNLPIGERCQIVFDGAKFRLFRSQSLGVSAVTDPILILAYQVASGANGGTATSGSRQTYPLNTQLQNTIVGAVFDTPNNKISPLPIGTYDVSATAEFMQCNGCSIFLHNDTSGADVPGLGISRGYASNADHSTLNGRFSIAVASIIKLQYFVQTTSATDGLGAGTVGDPGAAVNSFGFLTLRKIA